MATDSGSKPAPVAAALAGRCPRCAAPGLFDGLVRFAPRCRACGLDFKAMDVDDGPAAFLIFIVGAIVTGGAIWLELAASPRWWVHLIWIPVALGLTLGGLRFAKAFLLARIYETDAREGRLRK